MYRLIIIFLVFSIAGSVNAQVAAANEPCAGIERFVDDSVQQVKLHTPVMWNDKVVPIIFTKLTTPADTTFTLYLSTHSDMVFKDPKGVIVAFTDSTIWRKPGDIKAFKVNDKFEYNVLINLTAADVRLFATRKIANYVLYLFNQDIDLVEAEYFQHAVQCVNEAR